MQERYEQVRRAINLLGEDKPSKEVMESLLKEAQELELLGADGQILLEEKANCWRCEETIREGEERAEIVAGDKSVIIHQGCYLPTDVIA